MRRLLRRLGRSGGAIGGEIADRSGHVTRFSIAAQERGYLVPAVPAVLATGRLLRGEIKETGLIPHRQQVDAAELLSYLKALGFRVTRSPRESID